MKMFFYNLNILIFVLFASVVTNLAHAELRADIALPQGYVLDRHSGNGTGILGVHGLDNPESAYAKPDVFYCKSPVCGGSNVVLDGFSLIAEHHDLGVGLIGATAWFNVAQVDGYNSYHYVATCQIIAYNVRGASGDTSFIQPIIQSFCSSSDIINNLMHPWSISAFYYNFTTGTNPYMAILFAPATSADQEISAVQFKLYTGGPAKTMTYNACGFDTYLQAHFAEYPSQKSSYDFNTSIFDDNGETPIINSTINNTLIYSDTK